MKLIFGRQSFQLTDSVHCLSVLPHIDAVADALVVYTKVVHAAVVPSAVAPAAVEATAAVVPVAVEASAAVIFSNTHLMMLFKGTQD